MDACPREVHASTARPGAVALGAVLAAALVVAPACTDSRSSLTGADGEPTGSEPTPETTSCDLEMEFVTDSRAGRDGIPALTDPRTISAEQAEARGVPSPEARVVGIVLGSEMLAIPHNILWYHEIVNLNRSRVGLRLAVTYCPLTGSALAFDRSVVGGDEFGVSGLVYKNNLVMYNRRTDESLWPQMLAEARCGRGTGTELPVHPVLETTWERWRSLHPETRVVSRDTGWDRPYDTYPYSDYEQLDFFYFPMPDVSARLPLKERLLGIPGVDGGRGVAVPFGALEERGVYAAVPVDLDSGTGVVLWDAAGRAARAYHAELDGEQVKLEAGPDGIFDAATGSRWTVEGRAVDGPLEGRALEPVAEAYVAFWGAWAAFFPETEVWTDA